MAEQRTEVGPAYYDGWQKQLADLRAENARLRAAAEAAILVLERYCGTGAIGSEPLWKDRHQFGHMDSCPLGRALGRPECGGQPMETQG